MNNNKQNQALEFNSFLILFGFSWIFIILEHLKSITTSVIRLTIEAKESFYDTSIIVDFLFLFLTITLIILFLKKKRLFLTIYISLLIANLISILYLLVHGDISYFPATIKVVIILGLLAYFWRSKGVKQTFIH